MRDYVRLCRARGRETFVPLAQPAGHGQMDFGEALAVIGGVRQQLHFFCLALPLWDACFVKACPSEATEVLLDGHVSAFGLFGGVPVSVLYDNTRTAVAKNFENLEYQPELPKGIGPTSFDGTNSSLKHFQRRGSNSDFSQAIVVVTAARSRASDL